jgi:hypothetical protein
MRNLGGRSRDNGLCWTIVVQIAFGAHSLISIAMFPLSKEKEIQTLLVSYSPNACDTATSL